MIAWSDRICHFQFNQGEVDSSLGHECSILQLEDELIWVYIKPN